MGNARDRRKLISLDLVRATAGWCRPRTGARACAHLRTNTRMLPGVGLSSATAFPPPLWGREPWGTHLRTSRNVSADSLPEIYACPRLRGDDAERVGNAVAFQHLAITDTTGRDRPPCRPHRSQGPSCLESTAQ